MQYLKNLTSFYFQKQGHISTNPVQATQKPTNYNQQKASRSQISMAKLFTKYDVHETSYHLHTGRIDLHLCDDSAPGKVLSILPFYFIRFLFLWI